LSRSNTAIDHALVEGLLGLLLEAQSDGAGSDKKQILREWPECVKPEPPKVSSAERAALWLERFERDEVELTEESLARLLEEGLALR
jgi:hypothetical protein